MNRAFFLSTCILLFYYYTFVCFCLLILFFSTRVSINFRFSLYVLLWNAKSIGTIVDHFPIQYTWFPVILRFCCLLLWIFNAESFCFCAVRYTRIEWNFQNKIVNKITWKITKKFMHIEYKYSISNIIHSKKDLNYLILISDRFFFGIDNTFQLIYTNFFSMKLYISAILFFFLFGYHVISFFNFNPN